MNTWITGGMVGLVLIVGGYFLLQNNTDTVQITDRTTVQRGDIANSVLVFGRAGYEDLYELSFDVSGKLISYPFEEGDEVEKGEIIAKLDSSTVRSQIARSQSAVNIERSRLSSLKSGISNEEQATLQARIDKQQLVIEGAESDFATALANSLDDYYELLEKVIDPLYLYPRSAENIILRFKEAQDIDESTRQALSRERAVIESSYRELKTIQEVGYKYSLYEGLIKKTQSLARSLSNELDDESGVQARLTQDELEDFEQDLQDLYDTLNTFNVAWSTAQQELTVLENDLETQLRGADTSSIALQESVIRSKQSDLGALYTDLSKLTLEAPIGGVVFDAPLSNFQTVSPGEIVLTLTEDKPLVVFADVAESDVAFVGLGNEALVTFDALREQEFMLNVQEIKNRENLNSAVPTYRTTFAFAPDQDISEIRSGMTANITVLSGGRTEVLYIPVSFLVERDGVQGVLHEEGEKQVRFQPVGTGVTTNSGLVEIISGVAENQEVVITK